MGDVAPPAFGGLLAGLARQFKKPASSPLELSRLVMVATSAWRIRYRTEDPGRCPHGHPRRGHAALLRHLVTENAPGQAWLGRDKEGAVEYLGCGSPDIDVLVNSLDTAVQAKCADARERMDRSIRYRRRDLWELRHRIVLDPTRLHAVTQPLPDHPDLYAPDGEQAAPLPSTSDALSGGRPAEHLVALDLRFDFYLDNPLCHLSMSVWSARPLNDRYVPSGWPERRASDHNIGVADLGRYADRFQLVLRKTIDLLDCFLAEPELRVYRRKHVLPIFWIPVPRQLEDDAATYQANQPELRRRLAAALLDLGDPADCVATASVVNGEFDVLRRFRRGLRTVRPPEDHRKHLMLSRAHYLIIPAKPADASSPRADVRQRAYEEQEDRTADVITELTDLEARGASYLHDVHRDLQIWRGHLEVYDAVVERGAFLWDGLSTHLVGRGRIRRRAHHAVELLHQLLLQAIGDLAHLANHTRDCVARAEVAADQLRTDYDAELTEHHPDKTDGLRGALARIGLFEKVTEHGHQTRQEADRVKTIYDDLLRAVGYSFDEWRVRESDVVQRLSAGLGAFLALIGIVTVLDATVQLKPTGTEKTTTFGGGLQLQETGVWVSWFIGLLLLLVVIFMVVKWVGSGRLGSTGFRRTYTGRRWRDKHGGVWRLLKDMSTDRLEAEARKQGADDAYWHDLDKKLAGRFAALWDLASTVDGIDRDDKIGRDIKAQTRRIEQWGLHSLLLTERARRIYRYPLPMLTCLYRACGRLPGSFLTGPLPSVDPPGNGGKVTHAGSEPPAMIDFTEFAIALARAGLSWNQAFTFDLWLRNRRPRSARHLLELITSADITAPMTTTAIRDLQSRVNADLEKETLPEYPDAFADDAVRYLARKKLTLSGAVTGDGWVQATGANGTTYHVYVGLTGTPSIRELLALLGRRLRHPGRKMLLCTTGSAPHLTTLGRIAGIDVHATGWWPGGVGGRQHGEGEATTW